MGSTKVSAIDILLFIADRGHATIPEIMRHFNMRRSTAYNKVGALERAGLIERIDVDWPRRFVLTERGMRYVESARGGGGRAEKPVRRRNFRI